MKKWNVRAEIISVGTELLLGDIVNTDAAFLARELAALGISCYHQSVVGDNPTRLRGMLEAACVRSELVILTGGLGPTADDLTKETAAAVMGKTLCLHEESYARIRDVLKKRGLTESENQIKQAMLPPDAEVFADDYGTGPGFAMETEIDGRNVTMILMPGPPRELEPMFAEKVRPYLSMRSGEVFYSLNIGIYGIGEAIVGQILRDRMEEARNPTIAPYCGEGEVRLRLTARGESEEICRALCLETAEQIRLVPCTPYREGILDDYIFGIDTPSMQATLVSMLARRSMKVTTAESCTGGLIAKRITDVPGASAVFEGGFVTYADHTKISLLQVREETVLQHSVYSAEAVREMAFGAMRAVLADCAIAVSGVAGKEDLVCTANGKPLTVDAGCVYIACAVGNECRTECVTFAPGRRNALEAREYVRSRASAHALAMLIGMLKHRCGTETE